MFKKLSDEMWKRKRPKKYREYSEEKLHEEYDKMREEFAKMAETPDYTGEKLLDFLEKNQDLIDAVGVVDRKHWEEKLSKTRLRTERKK